MNKFYKVIWNESSQAWIAVSEITSCKIKARSCISLNKNSNFHIKSNLGSISGLHFKHHVLYMTLCLIGQLGIASYSHAVFFGKNSIPVGVTNNKSSIAIGSATSSGERAVVIGEHATSTANKSVVIGASATSVGNETIVVGNSAIAMANHALALGAASVANVENSIALGNAAVTNKLVGQAYITNRNTRETDSVLSIGNSIQQRRIQQVADGIVDQDAATVGQLKQAQTNLKNVLGNSAVDIQGNIYTTNIAETGKSTLDEAIQAVRTRVSSVGNALSIGKQQTVDGSSDYQIDLSKETKERLQAGQTAQKIIQEQGLTLRGNDGQTRAGKLGDALSIKGADSNLHTQADATGIQLRLAKNIDLGTTGSAAIGNVSIKHDLLRVGDLSLGEGKISGLKNTTLTDSDFAKTGRAATEEQLKQVSSQVSTGQVSSQQQINALNKVSTDALALGQSVQGLTLSGDAGQTSIRKLGDDIAIKSVDSNLQTRADVMGIQLGLAKNLNLGLTGSVAIGNVSIKNDLLRIGDLLLGEGKISGLKNTTLTDGDFAKTGRAATEEQLKQVSSQVSTGQVSSQQQLSALNKVSTDALALGQTLQKSILEQGLTLSANDGQTRAGKLGDALSIKGADSNLHTQADATGIQLRLAKNIDLGATGSVAIGNVSIKHDLLRVGDLSLGEGKISGLKNTTLTDGDFAKTGRAATEEQLKQVSSQVSTGQVSSQQQLSALNKVSTDALALGQTLQKSILEQGLTLSANDGQTRAGKLGDALSIKGADSNLHTQADATGIQLRLAKNIDLGATGSVAIGNVSIKHDLLRIGDLSLGEGKISGLKNTTLTDGDFAKTGRAATEEQLKQVSSQVSTGQVSSQQQLSALNKVSTDALALGQTLQKSILEQGLTLSANDGQTRAGKLGDALSIKGADSNLHTQADATGIQLRLAKNIDLGATGSVAIGNVSIKHDLLRVGDLSLGEGKISGLKNTTLTDGDFAKTGRAATEEQLKQVSSQVSTGQVSSQQQLSALNKVSTDALALGQTLQKSILEQGLTLSANDGQTRAGKLGDALSIKGADSNLHTQADATGIQLRLAKNIDLGTTGSVAIGNVSIKHDLLRVGDLSLGQGKISGLKNTTLTDSDFAKTGRAATEEQLKQVSNQVSTGQVSSQQQLSALNKVSTDALALGQTLQKSILEQGLTLSANDGQTRAGKLGDALSIKGADSNLHTQADATGIQLRLAKNIDLGTTGSVAIGNVSIKHDLLRVGDLSLGQGKISGLKNTTLTDSDFAKTGRAATEEQLQQIATHLGQKMQQVEGDTPQYSKHSDGSSDKSNIVFAGTTGTKLSNVADGRIAEDSKEAVTGRQLWSVQTQVTGNKSEIQNLRQRLDNTKPVLVEQEQSNITLAQHTGGNKVNVAGTDGDRVISGVAEGKQNNDVATVKQLHASQQNLVKILGGGATYNKETQNLSAPNYQVGRQAHHDIGSAIHALNQSDQMLEQQLQVLDKNMKQSISQIGKKIDQVYEHANAGIAAAMALESAPFVPGKFSYAAGAAHHGGQSAIGMTFRHTAESGIWAITGGVAAATTGDPSIRIGVSGVID